MMLTKTKEKTTSLLKELGCIRLSACFLCILLNSCKKADKDPYYRLPVDGLGFIQLRHGQYFIYKDSVSGTLDSVIVTESKLEKQHSNGSGQSKYSIDYDVYSLTLTKFTATGSTIWLKGFASTTFSNTDFTLLSSQTNSDWNSYMFRYPVGYGGLFPNDRIIPVLVVAGKQYTQVILTTGNKSNDSKFYWTKGIGLVRYERGGPAPQTFTLLRNN